MSDKLKEQFLSKVLGHRVLPDRLQCTLVFILKIGLLLPGAVEHHSSKRCVLNWCLESPWIFALICHQTVFSTFTFFNLFYFILFCIIICCVANLNKNNSLVRNDTQNHLLALISFQTITFLLQT